jgi:uncharacterized membrane protein
MRLLGMERVDMKLAILVAGVLAVIFISGCSTTGNTGAVTGQPVVSDSNVMKIPLSEITSSASFYTYNAGGKTVKFFAVRGSDGEVRTAFDACDVCGGYKGYRQQGNDMVCNNCGRYFNIDSIGTKNRGGGCWPSYLGHVEEGDYIVIKESDISAGKYMF